jgi:hypothetical protein
MPFCPECQSEYREGFDRCASCDVALVSELPDAFVPSEENIRQALEGQELVPIVRGDLEVVKEYRDLLSQHRLAGLIVEDEEAPAHPGMPKRVRLVVASSDMEAARQALGENFRGMLDEEGLEANQPDRYDLCPACGHAVAEDQEECPECGLFIGKG